MNVRVIADDLIWRSRLVAAVERAGAVVAGRDQAADVAIVDLNGRGYDGISEVAQAVAGGATVIAVAQHEDSETRKRALTAGARRVFSYQKMFSDGPQVVAELIAGRFDAAPDAPVETPA